MQGRNRSVIVRHENTISLHHCHISGHDHYACTRANQINMHRFYDLSNDKFIDNRIQRYFNVILR